jgi:hypothetical protein
MGRRLKTKREEKIIQKTARNHSFQALVKNVGNFVGRGKNTASRTNLLKMTWNDEICKLET